MKYDKENKEKEEVESTYLNIKKQIPKLKKDRLKLKKHGPHK